MHSVWRSRSATDHYDIAHLCEGERIDGATRNWENWPLVSAIGALVTFDGVMASVLSL